MISICAVTIEGRVRRQIDRGAGQIVVFKPAVIQKLPVRRPSW